MWMYSRLVNTQNESTWVTTGVVVALSWTIFAVQDRVQAATTSASVTTDTVQNDQQANQLQQSEVTLKATESQAPASATNTSQTSSANLAANSTASHSAVGSTVSATTASSVSAGATSVTAGASLATSATSAVATSSTVTSSAAAATSESPQSQTSVATATTADVSEATSESTTKATVASVTSTQPATRATAASVKPTAATTTADDDATVVTMADANLLAGVKSSLGLAADASLTMGDIRHTQKTSITIRQTSAANPEITSLTGLEALAELPTSVKLSLELKIQAENGFDLAPLENINFNILSLYTRYFSKVDLTPLTKIATANLQSVTLAASTTDIYANYHQNFDGMTNTQLAQISSWVTDFLNNGYQYTNPSVFREVNLSGNCLTDFSVLGGINQSANVWVFAAAQTYRSPNLINVVTGQPLVFKATEQIGLDGETLYHQNTQSNSVPRNGSEWNPITYLGDGEYQIDAPVQTDDYLSYGQWGYLHQADAAGTYYFRIPYGQGLLLITDAMIYRQANWQDNPSIQVNYLDATTGEVIKNPETLGVNQKLGDTVDLTQYTALTGYDYVKTDADNLVRTYTADPQTINLYFSPVAKQAAGDVKVQYVDEAGNVLATDTATYPAGQWVDEAYTTTARTIDGYTFKEIDSHGLAANGTLTQAGGTVIYIYQKDAVIPVADGQVTIVYVDSTTGKTLTEQTITGAQGSTSEYQTDAMIQHYFNLGYELIEDGFPSAGIVFDDQAPTYTVRLGHQIVDITETKTVTRTIHYVYADGTSAAADKVQQLLFTRTGQRDLVDWTTSWAAWQAEQTSFAAQTSPVIAGYQADQLTVPLMSGVTADQDDSQVTVTYQAITDPSTPDPDPEPTPDPDPDPEPTPDPDPEPTPDPDPEPTPDPDPEPTPDPNPEPTPDPDPEPTPDPDPEPTPDPNPEPTPDPDPEPTPDPDPEPTPDPDPEPTPDPDPEPTPDPEPKPDPAPTPAPTPDPIPVPALDSKSDAGSNADTVNTVLKPESVLAMPLTANTVQVVTNERQTELTPTQPAMIRPMKTQSATSLPQTNETPTGWWAMLGGLLLTLLGFSGYWYRKH
ncbi:hypothetical protein C5Z25_10745 [Lactobacillus sp. CBA3605]|uniref:mucin-binding protein n=1 Tax=Lactobacillus sp. CBA3605 TaxID=2099788 RepID=UPI000CFB0F57|nr:MucBP domain-containing protein [Lactobacillus sp. CBA3605]AVK62221.1 hypothetical protein C5Z25_10745 [Lactobacillus sp. CBA3605]